MKKLGFIAIVCLFGFLLYQTVDAEAQPALDYVQFAEEHEPGPYGGLSLYEQEPFEPIELSPQEFAETISRQCSAQGVSDFFQSIGLPFDMNDCEYVYSLKDHPQSAEYSVNGVLPGLTGVIAVSYIYPDYANDNCVFIFWKSDTGYHLADAIFYLGNIEFVTDAQCETAWLVGDTGSVYLTTRWYNIAKREIVLVYLAFGEEVDPVDYHMKVKTQSDTIQDGRFPDDQMIAIRKQVSIIDYTNATQSSEGTEIILYTIMDVYCCQPSGELVLAASKRFNNADIHAIADITCSTLISNDNETQ